MELSDAINKRRSIRKYKNKDVEESLILELLESARKCQSARNRQPWLFKVLKNDKKNHIADLMNDWSKEESSTKEGHRRSVEHTANIIKEAPILILTLYKRDPDWLTGDILSIGAAIEHICLKATDLDLGALWICNTDCIKKKISEYIGYEDLDMISAIAIGYSDEYPEERPRKELEEIIIV